MDGAKLLKFSLASILSFVFFVAVSYAIYPHLNKPAKKAKKETVADNTNNFVGKKYNPDLYGPDAVARLEDEISSLEQVIEELREKEDHYQEVIDSLTEVASSVQLQVAAEQEQRITSEGITEATSSLMELNEDVLAKILTRLDDRQLVELYHAAGRIQRGKLLRSLEPERAAKLLKQVIS